ncbi:auxin-responsive protein SAUR78 [Cucumis sativus]|uniref:Uncharacterized protein n=1 Tax=Cucumis sativus TaxID=3659 RepID=A0A0A0LK59_CUCSA|nr:auxin-responsive protein SAUR78 [Cucumis sativus]KGN60396.1 hypothetical protein Csa_001277 [Cucumis sativus]
MGCLVLPCYVMKRRRRRRSTQPHLGYHRLNKSNFGRNEYIGDHAESSLVKVVAGKERREFLVDPFVLEENPFRILIEKGGDDDEDEDGDGKRKRVIFVDVDAILFEHLLWLMYNDCSSLFKLNVEEILDFYAQDF